MKQFQYRAITAAGQKVKGMVEAKDEKSAVEILRDKGLLVTELRDPNKSVQYNLNLKFSKVSDTDLISFTKQFATMISSGLPMITSLELLQKQAKPAMAKIIEEIISGIAGGDSLYKALEKQKPVFSDLYLALIKAGETAGVLDTVMTRLSKNMDRQREFKAKVKGAMFYPIIVIIVMFIVMNIMIFFVIPKISDLFKEFNTEVPLYTRIVLGTTDFLNSFWYIFYLFFGVIAFGVFMYINTPDGRRKLDYYMLRIPYIGELIQKVTSTDIIKTLSLLIKSGVPIIESLQIVSQVATNTLYREGLNEAAKDVEKGLPLAASIGKQQFFPEAVIQMIVVGEETGKLDTMLSKIGRQFEKDSLIALKALTSAIEPTMIIILGVGVALLVFSVIVPMFSLTSSL